ncbi:MAG: hypothetical protein MZW92_60215 [Comamonadaceae bacterium]|nr:hypothetical protein [Comamonadaceae bacterium]
MRSSARLQGRLETGIKRAWDASQARAPRRAWDWLKRKAREAALAWLRRQWARLKALLRRAWNWLKAKWRWLKELVKLNDPHPRPDPVQGAQLQAVEVRRPAGRAHSDRQDRGRPRHRPDRAGAVRPAARRAGHHRRFDRPCTLKNIAFTLQPLVSRYTGQADFHVAGSVAETLSLSGMIGGTANYFGSSALLWRRPREGRARPPRSARSPPSRASSTTAATSRSAFRSASSSA